MSSNFFKIVYSSVIFIRIILPFLIFNSPVMISILILFFDAIDVEFASRHVLKLSQYENIDKALDHYGYLFQIIFSYFYLPAVFWLLLPLFFWRTIGEIIFYIKKDRKVFFVFPNLFENFFWLALVFKYYPNSFIISSPYIYIAVFSLFFIKMFQEWYVHVAQKTLSQEILNKPRDWIPE